MLYDDTINVIGNGVVLHPSTLFKELKTLDDNEVPYEGRLKISDRTHLLFECHNIIDGMQEKALKDKNIGTTKKGCYFIEQYCPCSFNLDVSTQSVYYFWREWCVCLL